MKNSLSTSKEAGKPNKQIEPTPRTEPNEKSDRKRKSSREMSTERPEKRGATKVVCQSPHSGNLFLANVNLESTDKTAASIDFEEDVNRDFENYQRDLSKSRVSNKTYHRR